MSNRRKDLFPPCSYSHCHTVGSTGTLGAKGPGRPRTSQYVAHSVTPHYVLCELAGMLPQFFFLVGTDILVAERAGVEVHHFTCVEVLIGQNVEQKRTLLNCLGRSSQYAH